MKYDRHRALELAKKNTPPPPEPTQIPPWREGARGIPNAIARSALFSASNGRTRNMVVNQVIPALEGILITLTGQELAQQDGDVFLQLVHMARGKSLEQKIVTTGYELLTALDSTASSNDYQRLKDSIRRLNGAQIIIKCKVRNRNIEYGGHLVASFMFSEEVANSNSTAWEIKLDPGMVTLFAGDVHTRLDWHQRLELTPLAKWLHAFYSTHKAPFAYRVETLHELCGSRAGQLFSFRQNLKQALDQLKVIGFLSEWELDKKADLVAVQRAGESPALAGPAQGGLL